jgi:flavin reductase (DIM6/NTAB) family NADH-FMN oxidoreductase RutF
MGDVQEAFDALASGLEYPMFVVTAAAGDERSGCLVGFATQCSIDPPVVLVCVSKANHTYPVACAAKSLVVHYLGEDDLATARLFGERTGDDTDKLALCSWRARPDGTPVLYGCRGWVAGDILSRTDVGDHVAFAVAVTAAEARDPRARQLGFGQVKDFSPGHPA